MRILIDRTSEWSHVGSSPVGDEERHYYIAGAPYVALLVCRNRLQLGTLLGRVVDAQIGWDDGLTPGMARVEGRQQTKITVYRVVQGQAEKRLSAVLRDAPRE